MAAEEEGEGNDAVEGDIIRDKADLWVPRLIGSVTFLCSIFILGLSWRRRAYVFHRLVLGKQ